VVESAASARAVCLPALPPPSAPHYSARTQLCVSRGGSLDELISHISVLEGVLRPLYRHSQKMRAGGQAGREDVEHVLTCRNVLSHVYIMLWGGYDKQVP